MLANVKSSTLMGLSVFEIEIEVDAAGGLPAWEKVGKFTNQIMCITSI